MGDQAVLAAMRRRAHTRRRGNLSIQGLPSRSYPARWGYVNDDQYTSAPPATACTSLVTTGRDLRARKLDDLAARIARPAWAGAI